MQLGYDLGYVRAVRPDDRPRGLSKLVVRLSDHTYVDARPEWLRGTGQWHTGAVGSYFKPRCLSLSEGTIASLGQLALRWGISPYRSQKPVVEGYRRDAGLPLLYPIGHTPRGATSPLGLVGPVLEAIGLGYLKPATPVPHAPPDLYAQPSRRNALRGWRTQAQQPGRIGY